MVWVQLVTCHKLLLTHGSWSMEMGIWIVLISQCITYISAGQTVVPISHQNHVYLCDMWSWWHCSPPLVPGIQSPRRLLLWSNGWNCGPQLRKAIIQTSKMSVENVIKIVFRGTMTPMSGFADIRIRGPVSAYDGSELSSSLERCHQECKVKYQVHTFVHNVSHLLLRS